MKKLLLMPLLTAALFVPSLRADDDDDWRYRDRGRYGDIYRDGDWRNGRYEDRYRDKEWRKYQKERRKAYREAARERRKDRREWERERRKAARDYWKHQRNRRGYNSPYGYGRPW